PLNFAPEGRSGRSRFWRRDASRVLRQVLLRTARCRSPAGMGIMGQVIFLNMSSREKQGNDERFRRVQKDPRFWEMPEKEHKVKIDKRFQSMFHDQRFKVKQTVDKRGRPVNHSTAEDLKRFYKLSDSEEDHEEGPKVAKGEKKKMKTAERPEQGILAAEKGQKINLFSCCRLRKWFNNLHFNGKQMFLHSLGRSGFKYSCSR
ncbi:hypothetical protein GOODEAATRI_026884, partial [Goodea atripinnis]